MAIKHRANLIGYDEHADFQIARRRVDGRVVGIEILDASKRAGNPAALKDFSFELPGAA